MTKPSDYKAIILWGRQLGSFQYYITMQQEKACEENAPTNAIYKRHGTETWVTVDDLPENHPFRSAFPEWLGTL